MRLKLHQIDTVSDKITEESFPQILQCDAINESRNKLEEALENIKTDFSLYEENCVKEII